MGESIFAFIVVLGVLIFVHELGHFVVARFFGVGIEKFSLGFGPRIIGKTVGLTDYRISVVPLGGYVKMVGEEPDADIDPADIPISFTHKHVFKRIMIVAAGPLSNLLLAVVIFFGIYQIFGVTILKPSIGEIIENSPAEKGGLKTGDLILAIDGQEVPTWEAMSDIITASNGKTLAITVLRDDATQDLSVTPKPKPFKNIFNEEVDRYVLGIMASGDAFKKDLSVFESLSESIQQTYTITVLTIKGVVKLLQGRISPKTLAGPIMIAQMAGEQAKEGATNLVFFIALISINLAIINILPIPVLDGGHLVFFFFEAAIGHPVSIRVREIAQQAGIAVLLLLMIYVFYNDIERLLFS